MKNEVKLLKDKIRYKIQHVKNPCINPRRKSGKVSYCELYEQKNKMYLYNFVYNPYDKQYLSKIVISEKNGRYNAYSLRGKNVIGININLIYQSKTFCKSKAATKRLNNILASKFDIDKKLNPFENLTMLVYPILKEIGIKNFNTNKELSKVLKKAKDKNHLIKLLSGGDKSCYNEVESIVNSSNFNAMQYLALYRKIIKTKDILNHYNGTKTFSTNLIVHNDRKNIIKYLRSLNSI